MPNSLLDKNSLILGGTPKWLLLSISAFMIIVAAFAYSSLDVTWIEDSRNNGGSSLFNGDFGPILVRNLGAALLLYSGVLTFGLTTLFAAAILGLYVGATVSLGVHSVGTAGIIADVVWYVPFEFLGLIMAATAGLQPAVAVVSQIVQKQGKFDLDFFTAHVIKSLGSLTIGVALIVIGAAIESILIGIRT